MSYMNRCYCTHKYSAHLEVDAEGRSMVHDGDLMPCNWCGCLDYDELDPEVAADALNGATSEEPS